MSGAAETEHCGVGPEIEAGFLIIEELLPMVVVEVDEQDNVVEQDVALPPRWIVSSLYYPRVKKGRIAVFVPKAIGVRFIKVSH